MTTADDARPTIPDVIERFEAYHRRPGNGAWGSLHVVLDDGNVDDSSVELCREMAIEDGDHEGAALASILLRMTKTQRRKLPYLIWRRERQIETGRATPPG